jgi:hypothetical protein
LGVGTPPQATIAALQGSIHSTLCACEKNGSTENNIRLSSLFNDTHPSEEFFEYDGEIILHVECMRLWKVPESRILSASYTKIFGFITVECRPVGK